MTATLNSSEHPKKLTNLQREKNEGKKKEEKKEKKQNKKQESKKERAIETIDKPMSEN